MTPRRTAPRPTAPRDARRPDPAHGRSNPTPALRPPTTAAADPDAASWSSFAGRERRWLRSGPSFDDHRGCGSTVRVGCTSASGRGCLDAGGASRLTGVRGHAPSPAGDRRTRDMGARGPSFGDHRVVLGATARPEHLPVGACSRRSGDHRGRAAPFDGRPLRDMGACGCALVPGSVITGRGGDGRVGAEAPRGPTGGAGSRGWAPRLPSDRGRRSRDMGACGCAQIPRSTITGSSGRPRGRSSCPQGSPRRQRSSHPLRSQRRRRGPRPRTAAAALTAAATLTRPRTASVTQPRSTAAQDGARPADGTGRGGGQGTAQYHSSQRSKAPPRAARKTRSSSNRVTKVRGTVPAGRRSIDCA